MNSYATETKILNFFELEPRERKNAVSLNFGTFLKGEQGFFSKNHETLLKKVEQAKKKWGLNELKFEMDLKQGFKLAAGTISTDFYKTCEQIIQNNPSESALVKAIKETESDYKWSEFFLEPGKDSKINFRFGREQNTGIIPYATVENESRDIYVKNDKPVRTLYNCSIQEKKVWIKHLKEKATQEEMEILAGIEMKATFAPETIGQELKQMTSQIFRRKANERAWKFELSLQKELLNWEKEMNEWAQSFCLRTELAFFLEKEQNRYRFDRVGWMKKTA